MNHSVPPSNVNLSHSVSTSAESRLTLPWLASARTIAIPVYQRDYRWRQDACTQLLNDIRAIATPDVGRTHFIGSILSTTDTRGTVTLVDGQQRVTTLMLILAAIADHASAAGSEIAVLARSATLTENEEAGATARLRPHERFVERFDALMAGSADEQDKSALMENYRLLHASVADDWHTVWEGLQRIEHVDISLGQQSNAQQIFESLNSTGAVLSDDELIHNYVHMGRHHDEQVALERDTWEPIERATEGQLGSFWRDYLILTSGTQPDTTGSFGVYRVFRARYSDPLKHINDAVRAEWLRLAESYTSLLKPECASDVEMKRELRELMEFEGAARPLILGIYDRFRAGTMPLSTAVDLLRRLQTMLIRRAMVDMPRGLDMIGTMCRELQRGDDLAEAIAGRTPEDPAMRLAFKHARPAHQHLLLRRLQRPPEGIEELEIEHIYPQTPKDAWSGDGGQTTWGGLTTTEQAEYRAKLNIIGNLTLLEARLNGGASNNSFKEKAHHYSMSQVAETREMADLHKWDITSIEERSDALAERFIVAWPRLSDRPMDEPNDLVKVVDLVVPEGASNPAVFAHAVFCGHVWGDVHDVRTLYTKVAQELWKKDPVLFASLPWGDTISATKAPATFQLEDGSWLYRAWWPSYLAAALRAWIEGFELQDEVLVKMLDPDEG